MPPADISSFGHLTEVECEQRAREVVQACSRYDPVHLLTGLAFPNLVLRPADAHPAILEYAHHIILTQPPSPCSAVMTEADIEGLLSDLRDLFARAAMARLPIDPSRGRDPHDELRDSLSLDDLYVRGKSFLVHQLALLESLFGSVDDWLKPNLGISSDDVTRTARYLFESLQAYVDGIVGGLQSRPTAPPGGSFAAVMQADLFRFSPPDDGVSAVLSRLAADPGSKPAPVRLSPGREWATSRDFPILRANGGLYCFNPQALIDELPRLLGTWIQVHDPAFFDRVYVKRRERCVARMALDCFKQALPGAQTYAQLFYNAGTPTRAETDGLVVYDDVAIIIEAKAKALSFAARRGYGKRVERDFGELVGEAFGQARRAAKFIREHSHAEFMDEKGRPVLTVNGQSFRRVYLVNPVLDAMDAFCIELGGARKGGLLPTEPAWPWSIFINDLCVVSDVLDSPSVFLLYMDRRLRFNAHSAWFRVHDELDLLDYFLRKGLFLEVKPIKEADYVQWQADMGELEQYYTARAVGAERPPKPRSAWLPEILALVRAIEESGLPGRTALTTEILALGEKSHRRILDLLSQLPDRLAERHRPQSAVFLIGDHGVTLWFTESLTPEIRRRLLIEDACNKYDHRANEWISAIFLVRESTPSLVDIIPDSTPWREDVTMKEVAQSLRDRKYEARQQSRKPGRNDRCPCGSGKKFKKCHGTDRV